MLHRCNKIKGVRDIPGLGSVSSEQIDRSTLEMVSAGLHCSRKMSKQIAPFDAMFGW
jgi:hypothetical protein